MTSQFDINIITEYAHFFQKWNNEIRPFELFFQMIEVISVKEREIMEFITEQIDASEDISRDDADRIIDSYTSYFNAISAFLNSFSEIENDKIFDELKIFAANLISKIDEPPEEIDFLITDASYNLTDAMIEHNEIPFNDDNPQEMIDAIGEKLGKEISEIFIAIIQNNHKILETDEATDEDRVMLIVLYLTLSLNLFLIE